MQYFVGGFKLSMSKKGAELLASSFDNPQTKAAISKTFAAAIANSIPGVSPDNVSILQIYVVVERRLREGDVEARRLQESARLQVAYVIAMDALQVAQKNISPQGVAASLSANIVAQFNSEIAGSAAALGLTDLSDVKATAVSDVGVPDPSFVTFGTWTAIATTTSTTTATGTTSTTATTTSTATSTRTSSFPGSIGGGPVPAVATAAVNLTLLGVILGVLFGCGLLVVLRYLWRRRRRGESLASQVEPAQGEDVAEREHDAEVVEAESLQEHRSDCAERSSHDGSRRHESVADHVEPTHREDADEREKEAEVVEADRLREAGDDHEERSSHSGSRRHESVAGHAEPTHGEDAAAGEMDALLAAAALLQEPGDDDEERSYHGWPRPAHAEAGSAAGSGHATPSSRGELSGHAGTWGQEAAEASSVLDEGEGARSEATARWHPTRDEGLQAPVFALYEDGESIEYYSRRHRRWIPAKVRTTTVPGTLHTEPQVTYSVAVRSGRRPQRHYDVPVYLLRHTLSYGEAVEMYSVRRDRWVEAFVEGMPGPEGITVLIEEDDIRLLKVPTGRVRRRFLHGERVSAYRGPSVGFVSAEVDFDGAPQGSMELEVDVEGRTVASAQSTDTESPRADLVGPAQECAWTLVPVRLQDETCVQWVPSYFLASPVIPV